MGRDGPPQQFGDSRPRLSGRAQPGHAAVANDQRLATALELFIDLHLISRDHFVGFVGHADHRH
jgi:hypothetical protein